LIEQYRRVHCQKSNGRDSDNQTNERAGYNLKEKGEEKKKGTKMKDSDWAVL